jgi:hypothetical protein
LAHGRDADAVGEGKRAELEGREKRMSHERLDVRKGFIGSEVSEAGSFNGLGAGSGAAAFWKGQKCATGHR